MAANDGARRHWRHAQRTSPASPVRPLPDDGSLTGRDSGARVRTTGTAASGDSCSFAAAARSASASLRPAADGVEIDVLEMRRELVDACVPGGPPRRLPGHGG